MHFTFGKLLLLMLKYDEIVWHYILQISFCKDIVEFVYILIMCQSYDVHVFCIDRW
jgi:hypothetical protein